MRAVCWKIRASRDRDVHYIKICKIRLASVYLKVQFISSVHWRIHWSIITFNDYISSYTLWSLVFCCVCELKPVHIILKAAVKSNRGKQLVSNVFSCSREGVPQGEHFKQAEKHRPDHKQRGTRAEDNLTPSFSTSNIHEEIFIDRFFSLKYSVSVFSQIIMLFFLSA